VTVHVQHIILGYLRRRFPAAHLASESPLGGIVFQQVSQIIRRDDVIHGDDFELLSQEALVAQRTKDQAADSAKAVDANFSHI
jgi:hypothetical protein